MLSFHCVHVWVNDRFLPFANVDLMFIDKRGKRRHENWTRSKYPWNVNAELHSAIMLIFFL